MKQPKLSNKQISLYILNYQIFSSGHELGNLNQENDSINFSKNLLTKARISTTPGIAFGPTGENHIRLSFCVPEEMINKAFDRMGIYFKKTNEPNN